MRRIHARLDEIIDAVGTAGFQSPLYETQRGDDTGQHIVKVVRNATGKLSDSLHLMSLPKLIFSARERLFPLQLFGYIPRDTIKKTSLGNRCP